MSCRKKREDPLIRCTDERYEPEICHRCRREIYFGDEVVYLANGKIICHADCVEEEDYGT